MGVRKPGPYARPNKVPVRKKAVLDFLLLVATSFPSKIPSIPAGSLHLFSALLNSESQHPRAAPLKVTMEQHRGCDFTDVLIPRPNCQLQLLDVLLSDPIPSSLLSKPQLLLPAL